MPEDTSSTRIDEASDSLNTGKFYFLLLFVSLIGVIGALMMIVFVFLQDSLTALLWNDIPVDSLSPVFNPLIMVICVAGGLGAGVIRHYFKGEIAIMAEDLIEFNEKGRFTLKRGAELFLRGLVSLVCGAPLGPEAPLTVASGAVGGAIAERARMPPPVATLSSLSAISGFFGAFLTSPFAGALIFIETTLEKGIMTWKSVLPSIVAATAGFAVYFLVSGSFIGGAFTLPPYGGFKDIDLLYAVGLGLIGGHAESSLSSSTKKCGRFSNRWSTCRYFWVSSAVLGWALPGCSFPSPSSWALTSSRSSSTTPLKSAFSSCSSLYW